MPKKYFNKYTYKSYPTILEDERRKKYLVDEISSYLDKSSYFFLTNYESITVEETNTLREQLNKFDAEFHVVKNRMLKVAVEKQDYPDLSQWLTGPTAIISGGNNPPGIAKTIENFSKRQKKSLLKEECLKKNLFLLNK